MVTSASGETCYVEGLDWQLQNGDLILPIGSTIPSWTMQELTTPLGSQPYGLVRRDGSGDILFGASHAYHDLQIAVTYQHAPDLWRGPVPGFAGASLPRLMAKLQTGEPVTLALFGDSIFTGCNAPGWAQVKPFQPGYADLVARQLEQAYGSTVALRNFAVSGMTSTWGVQNILQVTQSNADLIILAWGMNDSNAPGLPPQNFADNVQAQIVAVRATSPLAEFIVVSGMLPNQDWRLVVPALLIAYRGTLAGLIGPGVALADVSGVWAELLKRKRHLDVSGNGVNHPNDFGHRIYAQVLMALLLC